MCHRAPLRQQLQPSITRLFIVRSIDTPVVQAVKVFTKVEEQIVGGHGTAGKEIVGHPSVGEVVGEVFVVEDVYE